MNSLYPSSLKSKTSAALDLMKEFGPLIFIRRIIPWLFHRRYIFFSQILENPPSPSFPLSIPFRLHLATADDLPYLLELRTGYYRLPLLQKRLKEGHLCFLGWTGNRLIHVRWIFTRSLYVPYLRRTFILSSKEVYADEAYTKPEFRSLGIYIYAGYLLRQKLYEIGYRRYSCVFASWNSGPLKLSEKIGLKQVGKGGYLNFLLFKKFFWKGTIKDLKDGKISVGLPDSPDSSHHGEASPDPRA